MGFFNKKYKPDKFSTKIFDAILYYADENNKLFKANICKDYHATLFATFFIIYGIDVVNYFVFRKYGSYNKEVSTKLFSLFYERISNNFNSEEAEILFECATEIEDVVIEALKLPFEDGLNNPFYELALYLPTVLDIQDEYDPLYANTLLFTCLGEMFSEIGRIVNEKECQI